MEIIEAGRHCGQHTSIHSHRIRNWPDILFDKLPQPLTAIDPLAQTYPLQRNSPEIFVQHGLREYL
jgi:hypothetical protein